MTAPLRGDGSGHGRNYAGNAAGLTDREVLLAAALYAVGMQPDAIAAKLGVAPGAIRSTLRRVLSPRVD